MMNRTPVMQRFLDQLSMTTFGMTGTEAHKQHLCVSCRTHIYDHEFKTDLSKKEYTISALCQDCQDRIFKT